MNSAGIIVEGIVRRVVATIAAITLLSAVLLLLRATRSNQRTRRPSLDALVSGIWYAGLLSICIGMIQTIAFGVVNLITGQHIVSTTVGILLFISLAWVLGFWFGFGAPQSQRHRQISSQPVRIRTVAGFIVAGAIMGSSLQVSANAAVVAVRIIAISLMWGLLPLFIPYSRYADRLLSEKPRVVVILLSVIGAILLTVALRL